MTAGPQLKPKAHQTRNRILDAAEIVFSKRGFDAATTREIAAQSQTNVATPYSYFEGKDALYEAVLERSIAPLIELMDEFARERDKVDAASAAIRSVLSHLAAHEGTTRLIYREIVSDGPLAQRLAERLFGPLMERVRSELGAAGRFERDVEPFVAALFVHLSFGHVALAPLFSRVFGVDVLAPENLDRQVRVIGAAGGLEATREQ